MTTGKPKITTIPAADLLGTITMIERQAAEATRCDPIEWPPLTPHARAFLLSLRQRAERYRDVTLSQKQIVWLRDLGRYRI